MYHEEKINLLVSTDTLSRFGQSAPVVGYKYPFQPNEIIQTGTTRRFFYYPYVCFDQPPFPVIVSMVPQKVQISNILYWMVYATDAPAILVTLVKRTGGYFCIDMPLYRLIQSAVFHENMIYEDKIDLKNSYYTFAVLPNTPMPFVVPISFQMHNELRADKNHGIKLPETAKHKHR